MNFYPTPSLFPDFHHIINFRIVLLSGFCRYFVTLMLILSDREDLSSRAAVEEAEIDIALALKSQLLVNHGVPILFARLLDLIIHLRAMTTEYLEAILNSPLQGSSSSPSSASPVSASESLRTVSGTISASVESASEPTASSSSVVSSSNESHLSNIHTTVDSSLSASKQIISIGGSVTASETMTTSQPIRIGTAPEHNPIPVSSLIMSTVPTNSTLSHMSSTNLRMSTDEGNASLRPKPSALETSLQYSPQKVPFQSLLMESSRPDSMTPNMTLARTHRPFRDQADLSNAAHLPITVPSQSVSQTRLYGQGSVSLSIGQSQSSVSQEAHDMVSKMAAHELQLLKGSRQNIGLSPLEHQTRLPYTHTQMPLPGIGSSPLTLSYPQSLQTSKASTIPRPGSTNPPSFISLLSDENESTSEILRSDYQLVRGGKGLGPGFPSHTQSTFVKPISSTIERQNSVSKKIGTTTPTSTGIKKSGENTLFDLDSPPKRHKAEPDLIPKSPPSGDPSSNLGKAPVRDNGTVDAAVRWAAILEGNKPKPNSSGNAKPWTGSILETQLRKGIENVNTSQVCSSSSSSSTREWTPDNRSPGNLGVHLQNNQRLNSGVSVAVVSSTSLQGQSDNSSVRKQGIEPIEETSIYCKVESQRKFPNVHDPRFVSDPIILEKKPNGQDKDENLRKLLSSGLWKTGNGNGDPANSDTESETETKELGLK